MPYYIEDFEEDLQPEDYKQLRRIEKITFTIICIIFSMIVISLVKSQV